MRKLTNAVRRTKLSHSMDKPLKLKTYLHPSTLRRLRGSGFQLARKNGKKLKELKLSFEAADTYHVENFKVVDEETGNEIL